ncbi:hypothetical protein SynRS9907_02846 [Synechococcus sp. RS9907]|nr:hypothetical protein SynRS9907_02846 [Synechococcus sp. RS9907]
MLRRPCARDVKQIPGSYGMAFTPASKAKSQEFVKVDGADLL